MKFTVPKVRLGQKLQAQVVERNRDGSFIVNFEGDLLRVVNHAQCSIVVGQAVELVVSQLQPLQFQIQIAKRDQNAVHLDRQA
jgi:hypothetical protein